MGAEEGNWQGLETSKILGEDWQRRKCFGQVVTVMDLTVLIAVHQPARHVPLCYLSQMKLRISSELEALHCCCPQHQFHSSLSSHDLPISRVAS